MLDEPDRRSMAARHHERNLKPTNTTQVKFKLMELLDAPSRITCFIRFSTGPAIP